MNRGITVNRPILGEPDLLETAYSIYRESAGVYPPIFDYLEKVVKLYLLYKEQITHLPANIRNFHGLRDFYFLIKYICFK